MNRKGMTLIEIIVAIALLGIIAATTFPAMTYGYIQVLGQKKFTVDTFSIQQQVEEEMEIARTTDIAAGDPEVDIFGKTVKGHLVQMDIKEGTGTAHGQINVFVPKYKVEYQVPQIASVSLKLYRNGAEVYPLPDDLFPLDHTVSLEGDYVNGPQDEFLMNVYRWYMSPVTADPPSSVKDYIIIKEWNEARTPVSYEDSDDFSIVPNIEENYDTLDFDEFSYTDEQIEDEFAGRYFIYSVTPYSKIGRVGVEVFCDPISTNKITNIDDVRVTVPVGAAEYVIPEMYRHVQAEMLVGDPITVDVSWDNDRIDISEAFPETAVSHGTIIGYSEGIDFYLTAQAVPVTGINLIEDSVSVIRGQTYDLSAETIPLNATEQHMTWTSSDTSKVTVNPATGLITGVAVTSTPVTITVSITDGLNTYTDTCQVNVLPRTVNRVTVAGDTNIVIPYTGFVRKTYTATVLDQLGDVMPSEAVTWSLEGAGSGISINSSTGEVTVTSATTDNSFTVRATSVTNTSISGTMAVNILPRVIDRITISGPGIAIVPCRGSIEQTYTARVYDQFGDEMIGQSVTWSLVSPKTGVSISGTSALEGKITISSSANANDFTIRASSGSVSGTLAINAVVPGQVDSDNSSLTVVSTNVYPRYATFTATLRDASGYSLIGLSMDDFAVRRITSGSAGYQTLTTINNNSDYTVNPVSGFTNNGDGTYTWVIRRDSGTGITERDGVRVEATNPKVTTRLSNYIQIGGTYDNVMLR